ncbi:hypothetical protein [Candidatus Palauibacter sp.]|uniref:hypothetical protein n=1 Tax=Candidatus Palauibacter sp. TaxID=3101350 RepID=UPI003C703A2F
MRHDANRADSAFDALGEETRDALAAVAKRARMQPSELLARLIENPVAADRESAASVARLAKVRGVRRIPVGSPRMSVTLPAWLGADLNRAASLDGVTAPEWAELAIRDALAAARRRRALACEPGGWRIASAVPKPLETE